MRCNIPNPLSLAIPDILACLRECKKACMFYQEHGQHFCLKHLNNRLRIAQKQEDEEAFTRISVIISVSSNAPIGES
jgi:hypothetical protein